MSADVVIAVDIGGTTIAGGLVTPTGEIVGDERLPARPEDRTTLASVEALIERLRARAGARVVRGIGVGVPGPVDVATGRVAAEVPHAPDLADRPLGALLRARFGGPVYVDNDVNALALGEWRFGAGRGVRSLVVLAPGTGFGSGIILDGRLVRGVNGYAGEFGHTPVKYDGPRCWCGGRGCLAIYASGRGIAEAARARVAGTASAPLLAAAGGDPEAITAALVFRAAATGDPAAVPVVDDACQALGAMIGTIVHGLNPEAIVITGGVSESFVALEKRISRPPPSTRSPARSRPRASPSRPATSARRSAARRRWSCTRKPRPAVRSRTEYLEGRHGSAGASRAAHGGIGGRLEPPMLD